MTKRTDSLLGHCLARATLASGYDGSTGARWAVVKATAKASRVAAFIVLWAADLHDHGPAASNAEAQRRSGESERSFYRHLAEFRELWPEYSTPDPIALLLVDELGARGARSGPLVPVTL